MTIELIKGDITRIRADAIVNAANSELMGGGGVDGAIHDRGGPSIKEECRVIRERNGGCPPGKAVATNGGDLPASKIIHTVGPVWRSGQNGEAGILRQCYVNTLKLAESLDMKTIAFPNISTGVYGFPKMKAAQGAIEAVLNFNTKAIERITFVCFDDENFRLYRDILNTKNVL